MTPQAEKAFEEWHHEEHRHGLCKLHCRAAFLASWQQATEAMREECCKAIRENCTACSGAGFVVEEYTESEHGCNGDERECQTTCPVPVAAQRQIECEYCGRPIAAIRQLKGEG